MIILNPPWRGENGVEYKSARVGFYELETDGDVYEEQFYDSMEEMYGGWLRENKIKFKFTISINPIYTDYILKPAIRFENKADAMAFKLRWL